MQSPVTLEEVVSNRDTKRFITSTRKFYGADPAWVPPFTMELMDRLDRKKNPFFAHAEMKSWLAIRDGEVVGRISAQIDELALKHHHPTTGHFGFFDCINDETVAASLLDVAEGWLRSRGMTRVIGPYNPTISEEPGVLVRGFDTPPMMLMGHSQPYTQTLLEQRGYEKVKDLYAFFLDIRQDRIPDNIKRLMYRHQQDGRLRLRKINMKRYAEDLRIILDIYNDAWAGNWGFLPMTEAELAHTAEGIKLLIREDYTYIAEDGNGRPIGMMVTLPNLNEIMKAIDGKLLPFGWAKLVYWLKIGVPNTVRVPLMGVLQEIQNSLLGAATSFSLIEQIRQNVTSKGTAYAELSWILEDNQRMCGILEKIGSIPYKTYRVYGRDIG